MKKQIFTLIGAVFTVALFAQNPTAKIVLAKDQKILVSTTVTITSSSMGMDATSNSTSENALEVKQVTDKNYTISSALTKLKFNMDSPAGANSYDSEKKEDQETEIGKSMSEKLNKLTDVTIDNISGTPLNSPKPQPKKEDQDDANPMSSLLGMLGESGSGSDEAVVSGAFQLIPNGKKPGDMWSDSTIEKDLKVRRTYNFRSSADSGAVVQLNTAIESSGTVAMMGVSMEMNTTTQTTSDILVDVATGLVKRKTTDAEVTGNMQVMGQAVPISAKATTVSIYK